MPGIKVKDQEITKTIIAAILGTTRVVEVRNMLLSILAFMSLVTGK